MTPSRSLWDRFTLLGKVAGICVLSLIQLIPLGMIEGLLAERLDRRDKAVHEITSTWGEEQRVVGPILVIPFRYHVEGRPAPAASPEAEVSQLETAYFLPAHLKIESQVTPQKLHRGIYQAVVYTTALDISGDFAPPDFAAFKLGPVDVLWNQALLALPIHDLRGIQEDLHIRIGEQDFVLQPGSAVKFSPSGVHAGLSLPAAISTPIPFHLQMNLRGSDNLQFAPVGLENMVHLASPWPDPSFMGAFPPGERKITSQGFDATWRISYYGRNFPQQWRDNDTLFKLEDLTASFFGVGFLPMIDSYRGVERSIKYGIIFIALLFVTFFLFEILARLRLHLIQYGLVSAALVLFYLALLSLSEFIGFGLSYAIAAGLSTLLIGGYCARILASIRRALGLTAGLAAVYGALYVILQLEDYALLVGTGVLVAALALVMYVTRKVNWYGDGN